MSEINNQTEKTKESNRIVFTTAIVSVSDNGGGLHLYGCEACVQGLHAHVAVEDQRVRHAVAGEAHTRVPQQLQSQQIAQRVVLLREHEGPRIRLLAVGLILQLVQLLVVRVLPSPCEIAIWSIGHCSS